jgi:hypothetical protein
MHIMLCKYLVSENITAKSAKTEISTPNLTDEKHIDFCR